MKSELSEETDEENYDDPIKLFDNDVNAVYFGSHPSLGQQTLNKEHGWKFDNIGLETFCPPEEIGAPSEQTQTSQSTSECDFSQLNVRLVDCGKFPWYFRKYTEQILCKINHNKQSDSECEIDVEGFEDCESDDCYIVEDLQEDSTLIKNDQLKEHEVKTMETKPPISKGTKKSSQKCWNSRRDDFVLNYALSNKNLAKVDLKLNQGLVGMKITQKPVKKVVAERVKKVKQTKAKPKDILAHKMYTNAAEKALRGIGTELIPISGEKERNCSHENKIQTEAKDKDVAISTELKPTDTELKSKILEKVPVQLSLAKIPQNILVQAKHKCEVTNNNSILNHSNANEKIKNTVVAKEVTQSTPHVKDVKKTNKYKNDQIKSQNKDGFKSLIGLLVTNSNKEDTNQLKYTKQIKNEEGKLNKVTQLKKPRKKSEKHKKEPNSPILPCSSVTKKPKTKNEEASKCNSKSHKKITHEIDNLDKIVNKLTILNQSKINEMATDSKSDVSKINIPAKPTNDCAKQVLQKESSSRINKTMKTLDKHNIKNYNNVPNINFKASNINNKAIPSSNSSTIVTEQFSNDTRQDLLNKNLVEKLPVSKSKPCLSIKNNKNAETNNNLPLSAVVTPKSKLTISVIQQADNNNTYRPQYPTYNEMCSKIKSSQDDILKCNNRYASAIILKPHHQVKSPGDKNQLKRPVQNPYNTTVSRSGIIPVSSPNNFSVSRSYNVPVSGCNNTTDQRPTNIFASNPNSIPVSRPNNWPVPSYYNIPVSIHNTIPFPRPANIPGARPNNIPNSRPNNIPVPSSNNVPVSSPTNMPVSSHNNLPVPRPTNTSALRPNNIPVSTPSNISLLRSNNIPVSGSNNIPASIPNNNPASSLNSVSISRPNNIPVHTQPRCQDRQSVYPQYLHSIPSGVAQNSLGNSMTSANLYPPRDICQELTDVRQTFYTGWLPKNLAHLPPPPPQPPSCPSIIPPRTYHNDNQKTFNPYVKSADYSSMSESQITKSSSIIGINNGGLVKKINIVTVPPKNNLNADHGEEVKIPQIITPLEGTEVVATKTEMLEELDKLSFADADTKTIEDSEEKAFIDVAFMSKDPGKCEALKLTTKQRKYTRTEQPKGYSPPILPIPTYEKVLEMPRISGPLLQNEKLKVSARGQKQKLNLKMDISSVQNREFAKCSKRKICDAFNKTDEFRRRDETKKISLEEYKKRIFKNASNSDKIYPPKRKMCKKKESRGENRPNIDTKGFKYRENVDYSTETDLGYDSDSTVVL